MTLKPIVVPKRPVHNTKLPVEVEHLGNVVEVDMKAALDLSSLYVKFQFSRHYCFQQVFGEFWDV